MYSVYVYTCNKPPAQLPIEDRKVHKKGIYNGFRLYCFCPVQQFTECTHSTTANRTTKCTHVTYQ